MKQVMMAIAGAALLLGGCASANPIRMAQAAPVTYKAGEGSMSYAAVRLPQRRASTLPRAEQPRAATPAPQAAPKRAPRVPLAPQPKFDAAEVDTQLYAHQRVGKTYEVFGKRYTPKHQPKYDVTGTASWYGPKFHGKPTASGEAFDMNGLSAAHKTLPLNSLVHVLNVETGRALVLRVNDRGPFVGDRIIDLSKAAAKELGLLESGLKEVRVRYAGPADPNDVGKVNRRPEAPKEDAPALVADVPEPVAPAPEFNLEQYTPLRSLPDAARVPEAALPAPAPLTAPLTAPLPQPATPYTPPSFPPTFEVQPEAAPESGPKVLTIKGPIHLANSVRMRNPEYVRAASHR